MISSKVIFAGKGKIMGSETSEIKKAVFAGTWYPGDAHGCERAVSSFLARGEGRLKGSFFGGIVPHAGWVFSGSIACRVIASLGAEEGQADSRAVDTIVLFGGHMHPDSPAFTMACGAVQTPLGNIDVDGEMVEEIAGCLDIDKMPPSAFPRENTLELQYPFLKYFFPKAKIMVWGVPPSPMAVRIGESAVGAANKLGRNIRVIGSTDMTHYGPDFGFTPMGTGRDAADWVVENNDPAAIAAMEAMDADAILFQGLTHKNLCCAGAAAAAAVSCKKMGAVKGICLEYGTSLDQKSGQKSGQKSNGKSSKGVNSFVGYGGMVFA